MPGKLGVVEPGAFADILVVDGDPIKKLELLTGQGENLSVIMKAGALPQESLGGVMPRWRCRPRPRLWRARAARSIRAVSAASRCSPRPRSATA